jgi:hypothetical protein
MRFLFHLNTPVDFSQIKILRNFKKITLINLINFFDFNEFYFGLILLEKQSGKLRAFD